MTLALWLFSAALASATNSKHTILHFFHLSQKQRFVFRAAVFPFSARKRLRLLNFNKMLDIY